MAGDVPMTGDNFGNQSQAFLDWFKSLPGATFHPDIMLEDLRDRGAGRGIVATAEIAPDTVLFTIPRSRIICPATSELPSKIPEVFARDSQDDNDDDDDFSGPSSSSSSQDSWTSLILVMIYEHLRGPASPWKPYLDILPTAFDTPMFWSAPELRELQATSVASVVGRADADRMIATKILPVIRAHADVFFSGGQEPLSDDELASLAHRMGSTIMAYAFDLSRDDDDDEDGEQQQDGWVEDRDGRGVLGMVPMADLLNADADFNAHINHEEGALVATALRRIAPGDEVLNYYGPVSNGELLRRYGYVTPRYRRWDVVELPWALVVARIKGQLGLGDEVWAKAEKKADLDDVEDGFVIEWGSEDPDSMGHVDDTLEFHGLPDELAEQVKAFLKALRKVDPSGAGSRLSDSDARLGVFLASVLGALEDRAAQYPTTLEEDMARGERENPAGRVGKALAVRVGEKVLIREAQRWVRDKLQELGPTAGQSDEPAVKRQKLRR